MITYDINALLMFFTQQVKDDYASIEAIVAVLSNEFFDDDEKKDCILYTLRHAGLNEMTHNGGKFSAPRDKKHTPVRDIQLFQMKCDMIYHTQRLTVNLLNGKKKIMEFCLN